jgi:hypothetical protein
MEITKATLKTLGYIKHELAVVKILGDGDYSKHLTFTGIEQFSKSAQEKMATPGKGKSGKVKVQSIKNQKITKEAAKAARPKKAPKVAKAPTAQVPKAEKPVKVIAKPLIETQEVKAPAVRKTPTVVAGKVAKKAE